MHLSQLRAVCARTPSGSDGVLPCPWDAGNTPGENKGISQPLGCPARLVVAAQGSSFTSLVNTNEAAYNRAGRERVTLQGGRAPHSSVPPGVGLAP